MSGIRFREPIEDVGGLRPQRPALGRRRGRRGDAVQRRRHFLSDPLAHAEVLRRIVAPLGERFEMRGAHPRAAAALALCPNEPKPEALREEQPGDDPTISHARLRPGADDSTQLFILSTRPSKS